MLQTIYESDSCVSSDGVAGREQLLAQQRMHSMISSGMMSFTAGMFVLCLKRLEGRLLGK